MSSPTAAPSGTPPLTAAEYVAELEAVVQDQRELLAATQALAARVAAFEKQPIPADVDPALIKAFREELAKTSRAAASDRAAHDAGPRNGNRPRAGWWRSGRRA